MTNETGEFATKPEDKLEIAGSVNLPYIPKGDDPVKLEKPLRKKLKLKI